MDDAVAEMQARYPDDKFDIILRRAAAGQPFEWRVKCLDCPGKV
jgi:SWI/SNF-related matrix-associated actin-dependent regulator of chromatin subfamily B protein 1